VEPAMCASRFENERAGPRGGRSRRENDA